MLDNLRSQLLSLPESERAELAKFLLDTLAPVEETADAEWDAEIERRAQEIESGSISLKPGDVVLSELDARYP
jgi:putative addiction module component (TIGR02574 family)